MSKLFVESDNRLLFATKFRSRIFYSYSAWVVATPMFTAFMDANAFVFKVFKTDVLAGFINEASNLIVNDLFQSCLCIIAICLKDVFKHKVDHILNSIIAVFKRDPPYIPIINIPLIPCKFKVFFSTYCAREVVIPLWPNYIKLLLDFAICVKIIEDISKLELSVLISR